MCKLSVIIPVYNVENYLKECLDSVCAQSLSDIEIICVDDGSTDKSPDILMEYAKKDSRIKVITKENGGQASARNLGIKSSNGEYVAFVDADDFIEPEMFEKLYTKAKDDNLDLAMCKIATYNNQTCEIKDNVWYYMLGVFRDFDKEIFSHKDTREFTCHIAVTPYNKIYKSSLLKDNDILFPEGLIFEDEKFFYDVYLRAKRVSIVDEFLYYYRVKRLGSTVDIEKESDYSDIVPISRLIRETFKETGNYNDYKILLTNRFIHLQLLRFSETSPKYREKFFNLIKEDLNEVLKDKEIADNLEGDVKFRVEKILKAESFEEFRRLDEDKIFSVVMACYNSEDYLDETINSLIGQSFSFGSNIQLILVDDGSTDNTREICEKYQNQYPDNITYVYQENQGQGAARNLGLKYVKGKYVNFLDSDDKFSGNTFYSVYEFFEKNYDEIDFVSVPIFFFDKYEGQHPLNYKFEEDRIIDLKTDWDFPQLSASSAFFKKELFDDYSFKTDFTNSEDSLMINEMLIENPKYGVVNQAIYWYRKRSVGASTIDSSSSKKEFYLDRLRRYFKRLIEISQAKHGEVLKFIQYLIVYDLQWMLRVDDTSKILTNDEINEVYLSIQDVLSYVQDEVILSLRDDKVNISHHMLATKYASVNVKSDGVVTYENIASNFNGEYAGVYSGDVMVDRLDNHRLWLDIIEIKGNTLFISGFLMSFFKDSEVKIEIVKNKSETYPTKVVHYRNSDKKFLNCPLESQFNFDAEIPIENNETSEIEIFARFTGKNSTESSRWPLKIGFASHARMSDLSNYSISGKHFMKFKNNRFHISNYNYLKMIKSEIPILLKVLKQKESFYTSILAFRLAYLIAYPFYKNRRIWLFMDRRDAADDNGEHLYKYSIKQDDNIRKYFTVNEDCDDFKRLSKIKNVIPFYSIKQRLLYLFAEKVISSHPDENILNPFWEKNHESYAGLINSDKIFLQHGVTKDNVSNWLHKSDKNLKLIATVSEAEKESFLDPGYNYDEKIIKVLGFPRFDSLDAKKGKKQILIAPSWRSDLYNMTPNYIRNSDFFKHINSLINSEKLISLAKEYGYKIIFRPHPMVYDFIDLFDTNEYVEINQKETYQDLFKTSDLLITDYSSIAFDFSYMKKPVIYYQYGDDYNFREGYFKYKTMGFGQVIENERELIEKISQYLKRDCEMEEIYENRVDSFYKYNDKNNCRRVYDAILNLKN